MKDNSDQQLPPELEPIAARLRAERAASDPFLLDQIKGRVLRRAQSRPQWGITSVKARFATMFTLLALVGGTGGALAVAGSGGSGQVHSAAVSQYGPKRGPCYYKGRFHRHCPVARGHKGAIFRGHHNFPCRFQGHYYKHCPYPKGVKGVHAIRRHQASFTG